LARIVAPISGALPISGGLQLIVEREEPSPDTLFLLRSDETGGLISVGELQFADGRAEINVTDLECARPGATQLSFVVVTSAELEPEIFIAGANVSNLDNLWTVEDSTVVELVTCLGSNGTIRLSYQVAEGDTVALTVLDNLIEDEAFEAGNLDTFSQSPSWLADEPSVLYYADATEDLAAKVADRLSESLQQEFAVVLGAGQGVTDEQRGRLLIVHVPES